MQPYRFGGETEDLNPSVRMNTAGDFIKLSDGYTHYEIEGPQSGPATVLIHGFSVPYFIWDPTFSGLVSAGFRVLRYDLFGRGYSDRPDIVYDQMHFDKQLLELLDALNIVRPINLVGLSMGGAIAVGFSDKHPSRVNKLALIAPAGMLAHQSPFMFLLRIRGIGEWLFDKLAEKLITKHLVKDTHTYSVITELQEGYREQMRYRGFKRALLSTLRYGPLYNLTESYKRVGHSGIPVLLIWGKEDHTVPFALSEKVHSVIPNAVFHEIEKTGHIPHYNRPELVTPLIIDFLEN
jgi:pimeloyl-ACP methyl ester carboxylesterase